MSADQPRAARGSQERYARKAAALLAMLDHLPTVSRPAGGDPKVVERARRVIDGDDGTGDAA